MHDVVTPIILASNGLRVSKTDSYVWKYTAVAANLEMASKLKPEKGRTREVIS